MILAIDAGNTRIKWGLWEDHGFTAQGSLPTARAADLPGALSELPRPAAAIGSNVAGPAARARIEQALAPWRVQPRWIESAAAQCGVVNRYARPAQLGTDRWAALIGARARCAQACVVVNVGTAVTIDALTAQGVFEGGLILPGPELMARALSDHTSDLQLETGVFAPFPVNSADAIRSGALQAVAGAIEGMARGMTAAGHGDPQLIVSGGGADSIVPVLGRPLLRVPALVLEGLVVIARA
jgi:type III pantothenate kinase